MVTSDFPEEGLAGTVGSTGVVLLTEVQAAVLSSGETQWRRPGPGSAGNRRHFPGDMHFEAEERPVRTATCEHFLSLPSSPPRACDVIVLHKLGNWVFD